MLNYIWGGLIIFSLVFALIYDTRDLVRDTYRNGQSLTVDLTFEQGYDSEARRQPVSVRIDPGTFSELYGSEALLAPVYEGTLLQSVEGRQLQFAKDVSLPEPLGTIRSITSKRENDLRGLVQLGRWYRTDNVCLGTI